MKDPQRIVNALLEAEDDSDKIDWSPDPQAEQIRYQHLEIQRLEWLKENLEFDERMELWVINQATFSDYSGSMLERSNSAYLDGKYPFVVTVSGGHGTVWTGVREEDVVSSAVVDEGDWDCFVCDIEGLSDYPALAEDLMHEMEMEAQNESWEDYGRDDLKKACIELALKADKPEMAFTFGAMTDEEWDEVRYNLEGNGHIEWHDEHGSMSFNITRTAEHVEDEDMPDYTEEYARAQAAIWEEWLGSYFEKLLMARRLPEVDDMLARATLRDLWHLFNRLCHNYEYEVVDIDRDGELDIDRDAVRDMVAKADVRHLVKIIRPETGQGLLFPDDAP